MSRWSLRSRTRLVAIGVLGVLWLLPTRASAQTAVAPLIPASLFPKGMALIYQPDVTNAVMDSSWGKDELGAPFMHLRQQDNFDRQRGWMEVAGRLTKKTWIYFAIVGSEYGMLDSGKQGNMTAFADWQNSVYGVWNVPLAISQPQHLLPAQEAGSAETRLVPAKDGGPTVTIAGWWGKSHEIEALVIYSPGVMKLTAAKHMLAAQVRYAVAQMDGDAAPSG